jgi:hypothetical protein
VPPFSNLNFKYLVGGEGQARPGSYALQFRQVGYRHYHFVQLRSQRLRYRVALVDVDLKRLHAEHIAGLAYTAQIDARVLDDMKRNQPLKLAQMALNAGYGVVLHRYAGTSLATAYKEVAQMSEPIHENMFTVSRARGDAYGELRVRLQGKHGGRRALGLSGKPKDKGALAVNLSEVVRQVQSTKPLLYVYGYLRAVCENRATLDRQQCDAEYLRGYDYGRDVLQGIAPQPAWHMKERG